MPSMPSTGPWSFGKPNQFENPLLFEHRGFWHPTGRAIFASSSPLMYTWPTVQYYSSNPVSRSHLHQVPLGHGQPLQPQGLRNPLGWWWITYLCLFHVATTLTPNPPCRPTPHRRRWHVTLHGQAPYIDCYWLFTKQDLSTLQRNLQIASWSIDYVDEEELPPMADALRSGRTLDKVNPNSPRFYPRPHHPQRHHSIQQLFPNAVFHNEGKRATSLRIFCPMVYYECLPKTFADTLVFRKLDASPNHIIENTIAEISKQFGKTYPWALGAGRDLPNAYVLPKRKKQFRSGKPIVSFFTAPFRPMLNCIATSHRPLAGWKKELCSLTMSCSILIVSSLSLYTTFSIASASTSGTPGITTYLRHPWTSDGKTKLAIHLLSATNTDLLIFFMISVLIGLKVKNWAFYFPMMFDRLRLTSSLISCAWAAMRPFPIAICFHEMVKKFLCIAELFFGFLVRVLVLGPFVLFCFFLAPSQHLAPAVPWPNVIPCLPASRTLHLPWACHVVTHGDLAVMDIPVALLLLRTHLLHLAVTLIPQRLMLGHPSHLQDQVTIHPIMGTPLQTRPRPSQLLPITRLQFFQDLKKKLIHSRWNWQKPVVSFTHTTLSRFKHLKLTNPNRHFADLWWRKWIDVGSIETGSRSSSSMGSSATFVLVETVGLDPGINPPNLPTTGDAISKFQKCPWMEIGIPITMKFQKAQHPYKDPAWKTPTPSPPMWTSLHHLSRFNNWQLSSGTFSTMTGMPTWQYSNDSRIQMMTWQDIRSRSSRQQTWLTLPVTWQNPPVHCQIKPFAWRHFPTRRSEL